MYTLSYSSELENQEKYEIIIESPAGPPLNISTAFKAENFIRYRRYHIEYRKSYHEVLCPEYSIEGASFVVVVPWFLVVGRPYPIQIYLYAGELYSSNLDKGQRWAAKATQEEFSLEKFSHSTVCRSFKELEHIQKRTLERYFGDEFQPVDIKMPHASNKPESIEVDGGYEKRRFPSVKDTSRRRSEIAVFLQSFHKALTENNIVIETAAQHFLRHLYGRSERLRI